MLAVATVAVGLVFGIPATATAHPGQPTTPGSFGPARGTARTAVHTEVTPLLAHVLGEHRPAHSTNKHPAAWPARNNQAVTHRSIAHHADSPTRHGTTTRVKAARGAPTRHRTSHTAPAVREATYRTHTTLAAGAPSVPAAQAAAPHQTSDGLLGGLVGAATGLVNGTVGGLDNAINGVVRTVSGLLGADGGNSPEPPGPGASEPGGASTPPNSPSHSPETPGRGSSVARSTTPPTPSGPAGAPRGNQSPAGSREALPAPEHAPSLISRPTKPPTPPTAAPEPKPSSSTAVAVPQVPVSPVALLAPRVWVLVLAIGLFALAVLFLVLGAGYRGGRRAR